MSFEALKDFPRPLPFGRDAAIAALLRSRQPDPFVRVERTEVEPFFKEWIKKSIRLKKDEALCGASAESEKEGLPDRGKEPDGRGLGGASYLFATRCPPRDSVPLPLRRGTTPTPPCRWARPLRRGHWHTWMEFLHNLLKRFIQAEVKLR